MNDAPEPHCGYCLDTGCRRCEPGPLQRAADHLRWRLRRLFRRDTFTEEPPF